MLKSVMQLNSRDLGSTQLGLPWPPSVPALVFWPLQASEVGALGFDAPTLARLCVGLRNG